MKQKDMVPLMGKLVTVHQIFIKSNQNWNPKAVSSPWAGWVVGFRWKMDGYTKIIDEDGSSCFIETSRQLCILVTPWPTMLPRPVPLDGYVLGGDDPIGPDNRGCHTYKKHRLQEAQMEMKQDVR